MTLTTKAQGHASFWLQFGLVRGGRVTKVAGGDASYAPAQGICVHSSSGIAAGFVTAALGAAKLGLLPLLLASGASAAYAQDACSADPGTADWTCADGGAAANSEQVLAGTTVTGATTVELEADFDINTTGTGERGLSVVDKDGISILDLESSQIIADGNAVEVVNGAAGDVSVTLNGGVDSNGGTGLLVGNEGGATTITTADSIKGDVAALTNHSGTGALTIDMAEVDGVYQGAVIVNSGSGTTDVTIGNAFGDAYSAVHLETAASSGAASLAITGVANSLNGDAVRVEHNSTAQIDIDVYGGAAGESAVVITSVGDVDLEVSKGGPYGTLHGDTYAIAVEALGAASITIDGSGYAKVTAGDVAIQAYSDSGDISISDFAYVSSGLDHGIYAKSTSGDVTIDGIAEINAKGKGIAVRSLGGEVKIGTETGLGKITSDSSGINVIGSNGGDLTIVSSDIRARSYGITVSAGGGGTVTIDTTGGYTYSLLNGAINVFAGSPVDGGGDIIIRSGALTGQYGNGIKVQTSAYNSAVDIDVYGDIDAKGKGIYARTVNNLQIDITLHDDVAIETDYLGIHARSDGAAPISITAVGEGDRATADATDLGIWVMTEGDITISGMASVNSQKNAIVAKEWGDGNVTISDIDTVTGGFSAIIAQVDGSGDVTVSGIGSAYSKNYDTIYLETVDGDISVSNVGSVSTYSYEALTGLVSGSGAISFTNIGSIYSDGGSAVRAESKSGSITLDGIDDIYAHTDAGVLTLSESGAINIGGVEGIGAIRANTGSAIDVFSESGAVTIDNVETISANYDSAVKIKSASGAITISNVGSVISTSYTAIEASTGDAGTITISSIEKISGYSAGIDATTGNGDISISDIGNVSGYNEAGIHAYSYAGNITISGVTKATSEYGSGIAAIAYTGDISIANIARVQSFEDDALLAETYSGDISISNVTSAYSYNSRSINAVSTYGGDISVTGVGYAKSNNNSAIRVLQRNGVESTISINTVGGTVVGNQAAIEIVTEYSDVAIDVTTGNIGGGKGVYADLDHTTGSIAVDTSAGDVEAKEYGIDIFLADSDLKVDVTTANVFSIDDGSAIWVHGEDSTANITVNSVDGTLYGENHGVLIEGSNFGGSVSVTTDDVFAGNQGIWTALDFGSIAIDTSAGLVEAGGDGIRASIAGASDGGPIAIISGPINAGETGISARIAYADTEGNLLTIDSSRGTVIACGDDGIYADVDYSAGNISINTANIVSDGNGVRIDAYFSNGDVIIDTTGGSVEAKSGNGIDVYTYYSSGTVSVKTGDVTAEATIGTAIDIDADHGSLFIDTTLGTVSGGDRGILALTSSDSDLTIKSASVTGNTREAIKATARDGNLSITTSQDSTVSGGTFGIYGFVDGHGAEDEPAKLTIAVDNVEGLGTDAINAESYYYGGDISVTVDGAVTGKGGDGIDVRSQGYGDVSIVLGSDAQIRGEDGAGIRINANAAFVDSDNNVGISGSGGAIYGSKDGIEISTQGNVSIRDVAAITGGAYGIAVETNGTLDMDLASGSVSGGDFGISATSYGNATIVVGDVSGGTGVGIDLATAAGADIGVSGNVSGGSTGIVAEAVIASTLDIAEGGSVTSDTDEAVALERADWTLNNAGTITGMIETGTGDDSVINIGTIALRSLNATTGTEAVGMTDFGAGSDSFVNAGTLILATVTGETSSNASGANVPNPAENAGGNLNPGIATAGVEQAHLLNLESFANSGAIVLQDALSGGTGPVAGDVLVITGSGTAGVDGDGVFISDGGSLWLDTQFGDGNGDISDMLVVDGTAVGAGGATQVYLANTTPGSGALTDLNDNGAWDEGEGILLVEVLDASASAQGAFELALPVIDNGVLYSLYSGALGGDWYLVSLLGVDDTGFCGGAKTISTGVFQDALGCEDADELTVSGDASLVDIEGAGGADAILISGDANVLGTLYGGGEGQDGSAALDLGDFITIDTTGVVNAIDGQLGGDTITINNGEVGNVFGNVGADIIALNGGEVTLIDGGADNDRVTLAGGTVGSVVLGAGEDTLIFANGFDLTTLVDGGTDSDTVIFDGVEDSLTAGTITNVEVLVFDNGSDMLLGGSFSASGGASITGDSTISAATGFTFDGDLFVEAGSTVGVIGGNASMLGANGDLLLDGMVDLRDGATDDLLLIGGDLVGNGGTLGFDVDFATEMADMVSIGGDVTGQTKIALDIANQGAATGNPIALLDATGSIALDNFALENGPFVVNIYYYDLALEGDTLVLTNTVSPSLTAFEMLPLVLAGYAETGSLHDRAGSGAFVYDDSGAMRPATGIWGTLEASDSDIKDANSVLAAEADIDRVSFTLGGSLVVSDWLGVNISGRRTGLDAEVASDISPAGIDSNAWGAGAGFTVLTPNGAYVDVQGQIDWIDLTVGFGDFVMDEDADVTVKSLSLEAGYRLLVAEGFTLTPQAQFGWHHVDIGSVTGPLGETYESGDGNDWTDLRLGLAGEFGQFGAHGFSASGIVNLRHAFDPAFTGSLNGFELTSALPEWTGEVGGGLEYGFGAGSVFARASYETELGGTTDFRQVKGALGLRLGF